MDGTEIDSIVSTVKWDLELEVISVILRSIGDLADELGDMSVGSSTLLTFLISIDEIASVNILIRHMLSQAGDLFLSYLSRGLSALHLSQLTVVHLFGLEHESLLRVGYVWPIDEEVDVSLLRELQVIDMVNILPLQINSNYALLTGHQLSFHAVAVVSIAQKGKYCKEAKSFDFSSHFAC